jgi:hypothetical protein
VFWTALQVRPCLLQLTVASARTRRSMYKPVAASCTGQLESQNRGRPRCLFPGALDRLGRRHVFNSMHVYRYRAVPACTVDLYVTPQPARQRPIDRMPPSHSVYHPVGDARRALCGAQQPDCVRCSQRKIISKSWEKVTSPKEL